MKPPLPLSLFCATLALACSSEPAPELVDAGLADVPAVTDAPQKVDAPVALDVPVAPDVPVALDVPVAPDIPVALDVSATPDIPVALDVSATPDVPTCPAGALRCGGACVVPGGDPANCGTCGNVCGAGRFCAAGVCQADRCLGVACAPSDPCHAVGSCDRATGACRAEALTVTVSASGASPLLGPRECTPAGGVAPTCSRQAFDPRGDFAAQANNGGVAAVTSGEVSAGANPDHRSNNVNDGRYGNGSSWIPASANGWIKLDLGRVLAIDRVAFGRDRLGGFADRPAGRYSISVGTTEAAYANGDEANDGAEYRRVFDSSMVARLGESIPAGQTVTAQFSPVTGRFVKIAFTADGVGIDEVEVYGCDPSTTTCAALPAGDGAACGDALTATTNDRCAGGACVGTACGASLADCDGRAANACEVDTRTTLAHCGACGNACPAAAHVASTRGAGTCGFGACSAGFGNCDGSATNGCEVDLTADAAHCGACATACAAGQVCQAGACRTARHASFVFVPGAGTVHVYSPTANALRLALDVGTATATALPGMVFAEAGVRVGSIATAGVLRLDGDAPFVAWVHDGASGDKIVAAGALDGSLRGTELYTWSTGGITILAGAAAPSSVVVQRVPDTGAGGVTLDTWTSPPSNGFRTVATPTSAVYRVTSVGAPVTAFGQVLGETYNHFAYVPSDEGSLRGNGFRYAEPVGASGVRRMMVQSLDGASTVTFTVGATVTMRALSGAVATTAIEFPADTLVTATSTGSALAWIEADPGNPADGSLLDADFVPSRRGLTFDTEWTFRTTVATATGFTDRRADLDAIAFTNATEVQLFAAGATVPTSTVTIQRGQRARLLTDAAPDAYVRVVTSQPALVEQSHAGFQFAIRAPSILTYE